MITLGQNEWTVRRRSINIHEEYLFLNSFKIKQKSGEESSTAGSQSTFFVSMGLLT